MKSLVFLNPGALHSKWPRCRPEVSKMTPKVTQSPPKASQRELEVAPRAPSGVRLALWRGPWAHFGPQVGSLGSPLGPFGVSWTPQVSTLAAPAISGASAERPGVEAASRQSRKNARRSHTGRMQRMVDRSKRDMVRNLISREREKRVGLSPWYKARRRGVSYNVSELPDVSSLSGVRP